MVSRERRAILCSERFTCKKTNIDLTLSEHPLPPYNRCLLLDHYQLTNSTSDFKSRSSDVFAKLANLEKQHDVHVKEIAPLSVPDDDAPPALHQNPVIPSNAIVFKKRSTDDETFARPVNKWQKYDLDDVNEHHLSSTGNRHALNDFLRTRAKPSSTDDKSKDEEKASVESTLIFKRPMKREILTSQDDETDDVHSGIAIRVPVPVSSKEEPMNDNNNDDDDTIPYKLKATQKKVRGVRSTTEKKSSKIPMDIPDDGTDVAVDDEEDEDLDDELFEP